MDTENSDEFTTGECNICGKRIKKMRKAKKLTQKQLACMVTDIGVPMTRVTLVRIEQQSRYITDREFIAIAEALGVSVTELVLGGKAQKDISDRMMDVPFAAEKEEPYGKSCHTLCGSKSVAKF